MFFGRRFFLIVSVLVSFVRAEALKPQKSAALIEVKVAFVEALAPRDTTSSERFQNDYELAIQSANELLSQKLKSCGYKLSTQTSFYDASDALQAREKGAAMAGDGVWFIVGPRRSNHYILLAQGAAKTPSVSLMATSNQVTMLGKRHTSLVPLNAQMAKAAAYEAAKVASMNSARGYVAIVSEDCESCVNFAREFKIHARAKGLAERQEVRVLGDTFDATPAVNAVLLHRPAFVLIPNFSKVSSLLISKIAQAYPTSFYVGGDGWGDAQFGFVHHSPDLGARAPTITGFSVRGYPPIDSGLKKCA